MSDAASGADERTQSRWSRSLRWLVPLIVAGTFMYFAGAVALLYYQWLNDRPPDSVLIIQADSALEGAEVHVEGGALLDAHKRTMRREDGYIIPFYVNRGTYSVRISRGGLVREYGDVLVAKNQSARLDLRGRDIWSAAQPVAPAASTAQR
jgi:hypothetical protein